MEDLNRVLKGLQKATLRDFPNPERVGCPGAAVIEALANRRLPHNHEAVQHITHCSPCYAEFLAIRRRIRRRELHEVGQLPMVRKLVAKRIITAARRGELDPVRLRVAALSRLPINHMSPTASHCADYSPKQPKPPQHPQGHP